MWTVLVGFAGVALGACLAALSTWFFRRRDENAELRAAARLAVDDLELRLARISRAPGPLECSDEDLDLAKYKALFAKRLPKRHWKTLSAAIGAWNAEELYPAYHAEELEWSKRGERLRSRLEKAIRTLERYT